MNPKAKKAMKYGLFAAIIGGISYFLYRVWKRMHPQVPQSPGKQEGDVIDVECIPPDQSGENAESRNASRDAFTKEAMHAAADELSSWAEAAKKASERDWFRRLMNLDFFSKK